MKERKQTAVVGVRMSKSNRALLEERAKARGWKLSRLVYECLRLGFERLPVVESQGEEIEAESIRRAPVLDETAGIAAAEPKPTEASTAPGKEAMAVKEEISEEKLLADKGWLESFRREVRTKWPTLDFDAVMGRLNRLLQRHPERTPTRTFVRGFFKGTAGRFQ